MIRVKCRFSKWDDTFIKFLPTLMYVIESVAQILISRHVCSFKKKIFIPKIVFNVNCKKSFLLLFGLHNNIVCKIELTCSVHVSDKIQIVSCAGFCKWGPSLLSALSPGSFQVSLALNCHV